MAIISGALPKMKNSPKHFDDLFDDCNPLTPCVDIFYEFFGNLTKMSFEIYGMSVDFL